MKKNKLMSTFEREMRDPDFEKAYKEEYQEFALSELLLALMEKDEKSVRQLAKVAGVSANAIQNIRSGKTQDMRLKNFIGVVQACGYNIVLEKEKYNKQPARIKMNIMRKPVTGKEFFELMSLAVSAVNGCEMCVKAHEDSLLKLESTEDRIFEAVRFSAVYASLSKII